VATAEPPATTPGIGPGRYELALPPDTLVDVEAADA